MMNLTVKEIIQGTNGQLVKGDEEKFITGVSTDSRNIKSDDLFIPLKGENFDGHDFIDKAVGQGASVILVGQWNEDLLKYHSLTIIKVDDTLKALQDLAKYYISKFSIPIVAVTGSTGKTTTKDMIYSVLSQKYKVLKTQGNFNNHIGLPMTVFQLEKDHEVAIFEMGMSGFGEIQVLANIVKPNIAVITNIGLSHIEHLGSQENILKAKMEITHYFNKNDLLIVNGDDLLLGNLENLDTNYQKYLVGKNKNFYIQAINVKDNGIEGLSFDVLLDEKIYNFQLNVPGEHNIYNALEAILVGRKLKVNIKDIQEGIKNFKGSKMRLNISNTKDDIKVINDAYNASPDSMKAALSVLQKLKGNRKIAILGNMLEMGEYAKKGHYQVGWEAGKQRVDLLITVGKDAEHIGKGAIDNGLDPNQVFMCKDNDEVIELIKNLLQKEDIVLIKGSRGMRMEELADYIQERS